MKGSRTLEIIWSPEETELPLSGQRVPTSLSAWRHGWHAGQGTLRGWDITRGHEAFQSCPA